MTSQSKDLQDEALERLMHATSGEATDADLRALELWRTSSAAHLDAYRRALGIWKSLGAAASQSVTAQDRALIAGKGRAPVFSRRSLLVGGGMAAAATVAAGIVVVRPPLGLWPSWAELMADYHTGAGEQRTVALTNTISVEMNTRTSIVRRAAQDDRQHIELVSGEAVISATAGAPEALTVVAEPGRVIVESAQFSLRQDGGAVRVTCLSGSVRVECRGGSALLKAREQLVYSPQGFGTVAVVDPAGVTAWRQGFLLFRDEPFVHVLEEINRYWRGRIVLLNAAVGQRRVTVRIELARIDEVIAYVHTVLGVNVRRLPGGMVLLT